LDVYLFAEWKCHGFCISLHNLTAGDRMMDPTVRSRSKSGEKWKRETWRI
jgi:hypothetical protein